MAFTGTLRSWNDERGFGFIAPTSGGRELFVHISAFPRDGSRPTVGETLTYELGRGQDGKPAAVRVHRHAPGDRSRSPYFRPAKAKHNRSRLITIAGVLLVVVLGALAYSKYQQYSKEVASDPVMPAPTGAAPAKYRQYNKKAASDPVMPAPTGAAPEKPVQVQFRCDGRIYCSQMTSCSEARYFLKNCPGTRMDGDNDGVPCEQQWCTSASAK